MWYPHGDWGWEAMLFGGLMMILFWGGLILLAVWLFRSQSGPNARRSADRPDTDDYRPSRSALDILQERYARGEITKAEYQEIRDDLRDDKVR